MGLYIFVLAAALAVFGILFFFKRNVERIKEDPSQYPEAQKNFFIGTAISEALPIVLLVLGFANQPKAPLEEIYLPLVIVGFLLIFSIFFIFLQRAVGVDEDSKPFVTNFSLIAVTVSVSIPIIAIVFLFLSVQ